MIVVNDPGRAAGAGGAIGRGLGQGLGEGISEMLQHKVGVIRQQQQRSQLANALHNAGYTPHEAALLSMYPPDQQVKMMQYLQPNQQQPIDQNQQIDQQLATKSLSRAVQPQQQVNPLEQFNQNTQQQQQDIQKQQQMQQMQQIFKPYNPMDQLVTQTLKNQARQQKPAIQEPIINKPVIKQTQQVLPEQQPIQQEQTARQRLAGLTPAQKLQERKFELQQKKAELQESIANKKLALQEEKEKRVEQHKINKEVAPIYHEITKDEKGAREDDRRLGKMRTLIARDNLTNPAWHSFLNTAEHGIFGFGINLHALESADAQEFDKLSKEFLKNAKNIFGARLTDNDVNTFMKMVPTLSQSKNGKLAVINNMELYNQGIHIRADAAKQVLKENGGKLPFDFETRVDELAGPKLDQLAERFISPPEDKKKSFLERWALNPFDE